MNPNAIQAHWPVIDNVIAPLAEWWRSHAAINENLAGLAALSPDETALMAQDIGLAPGDLREVAAHIDAVNLLEKRLQVIGRSGAELARTAHAELRDMERLCTLVPCQGALRS